MNIKATGNATIDAGLANLRRALVTLDAEHQVGGRKASRRRVAVAMKKIQGAVDVQFPAMRVKGKPRKRLDRALKIKRLEKAGWHCVDEDADVAVYAAARVSMRHVSAASGYSEAMVSKIDDGPLVYIPAWAAVIGPDAKKLRKMGKSTQRKQAALAEAALLR